MAFSIKRLFLNLVLALAFLLASLCGWSAMMSPSVGQLFLGTQVHTHQVAVRVGCPPPPFSC